MRKEQEIRDFIVDLVVLKGKALDLELYRTFHILDDVTKAVGWEFAELLEKEKEIK